MTDHMVSIHTSQISLDSLLKWAGITITGGQAKALIATGKIQVNGKPELKRSRKLSIGDQVIINDDFRIIIQ